MSLDLLSIAFYFPKKSLIVFTVRIYGESGLGFRKLGDYRYAFDLSFISFLVERYEQ